MLEPDQMHGALSLEEVHQQLDEVHSRPLPLTQQGLER